MKSSGGLLRKKLQATNIHEVTKVCVNWLSCGVAGAIRVARDDVFSPQNQELFGTPESSNHRVVG